MGVIGDGIGKEGEVAAPRLSVIAGEGQGGAGGVIKQTAVEGQGVVGVTEDRVVADIQRATGHGEELGGSTPSVCARERERATPALGHAPGSPRVADDAPDGQVISGDIEGGVVIQSDHPRAEI